MKSAILTLLFFYVNCISFAQAPASVTGRVVSANQKPLIGATVLLLSAKDSAIAKTAVTGTDGKFRIPSVPPGNYFLSITSVGYSKTT